jgi:Cof subfamily protein (haloacid dehalogenase superfamily)
MMKMIVADMDGTLLKNDLSVSERTLQAIRRIRDRGIRFAVATGRPDQLMKEYVDLLGLTEPIILYNGTVIGHPFQDERLFERVFDKDAIRPVLERLEADGSVYMVYTKDCILSKPNDRVRFFQARNERLEERLRSVFKVPSSIDEILMDHAVHKILVIEKDFAKFQALQAWFDGKREFSVAVSQKSFLDINPPSTSKGEALRMLARHYGIDPLDVVAFGDQENDVSMFEAAGIGVAMGNASEAVKTAADQTTLSNEEDGFAVWIENNLK